MKQEPSGRVRADSNPPGKPWFDHVGGRIHNNLIHNRKGIHLESGIELMNVYGVTVMNNTVVSVDPPFSSIEYRWPNTRVKLVKNLVSHTIKERNDAKAMKEGNVEKAKPEWFRDHVTGDLRTTPAAPKGVGARL